MLVTHVSSLLNSHFDTFYFKIFQNQQLNLQPSPSERSHRAIVKIATTKSFCFILEGPSGCHPGWWTCSEEDQQDNWLLRITKSDSKQSKLNSAEVEILVSYNLTFLPLETEVQVPLISREEYVWWVHHSLWWGYFVPAWNRCTMQCDWQLLPEDGPWLGQGRLQLLVLESHWQSVMGRCPQCPCQPHGALASLPHPLLWGAPNFLPHTYIYGNKLLHSWQINYLTYRSNLVSEIYL